MKRKRKCEKERMRAHILTDLEREQVWADVTRRERKWGEERMKHFVRKTELISRRKLPERREKKRRMREDQKREKKEYERREMKQKAE